MSNSTRYHKKWLGILFLLLILILNAQLSCAQLYSEYEVKAAFLVNFIKFTKWPENQSSDTINYIGIYGHNPFNTVLSEMLEMKNIQNQEWKVIYLNDTTGMKQCKIVFFSEVEKAETIEMLNFLRKKSILTIGDNIPEFCYLGGIMNFTSSTEKKAFEINNSAAQRKNLELSSKLLILSKIIREDVAVF